ncbi:MAG: hypothetical protein IKF54_03980 [Eubacterium sp.]|nr:hypothetical protein [Eubacterium sp.]
MLKNKKLDLLISFILAFALWFYVVGQMNPETRKTYREIPIMLINEQTLSDNGLAVLNVSDDYMRVTVSGKRDVISKLSKADISATVDLADASDGKNMLSVSLRIPDNIEIVNQSLDKIEVNTEERVTRTRDVRVKYTGRYPEGGEPSTIKIDPENIKVSGAKSLVDKVAYVKAELSAESVTDGLTSATCSLTAVTRNGGAVQNISLSDDKCKVTSIIYRTKSVDLKIPVKDKSSDGYNRTVSYPDTVNIKGPAGILGSIDFITAEEVDITGVTENEKIPVKLILPEGVQAAENAGDVRLTVKVSKNKKKTSAAKDVKSFTFTKDDVELRNAGAADISLKQENLEVQVTGTREQLAAIRSSDIVLYVDVSGIDSSAEEADITAECSKKCSDIAVIPSKIALIRKEEE